MYRFFTQALPLLVVVVLLVLVVHGAIVAIVKPVGCTTVERGAVERAAVESAAVEGAAARRMALFNVLIQILAWCKRTWQQQRRLLVPPE